MTPMHSAAIRGHSEASRGASLQASTDIGFACSVESALAAPLRAASAAPCTLRALPLPLADASAAPAACPRRPCGCCWRPAPARAGARASAARRSTWLARAATRRQAPGIGGKLLPRACLAEGGPLAMLVCLSSLGLERREGAWALPAQERSTRATWALAEPASTLLGWQVSRRPTLFEPPATRKPSARAPPSLRPQTVRLLLAAAPEEVGTLDIDGRTPLYAAAMQGSARAVRRVLEAPGGAAQWGVRAADGLAPLHVAATIMHPDVVDVLLEYGPADVRTDDGRTALMCVGKVYHMGETGSPHDGAPLPPEIFSPDRPRKAAAIVRSLVAAGGWAAARGDWRGPSGAWRGGCRLGGSPARCPLPATAHTNAMSITTSAFLCASLARDGAEARARRGPTLDAAPNPSPTSRSGHRRAVPPVQLHRPAPRDHEQPPARLGRRRGPPGGRRRPDRRRRARAHAARQRQGGPGKVPEPRADGLASGASWPGGGVDGYHSQAGGGAGGVEVGGGGGALRHAVLLSGGVRCALAAVEGPRVARGLPPAGPRGCSS
jgi:hypothetical protein